MTWFLYIAQCNDGSLYTGITTDLARREKEHNFNDTLGAKSLRYKRPISIIYFEQYKNQSKARTRESEIKHWKRKYKLKLVSGFTLLRRKPRALARG